MKNNKNMFILFYYNKLLNKHFYNAKKKYIHIINK